MPSSAAGAPSAADRVAMENKLRYQSEIQNIIRSYHDLPPDDSFTVTTSSFGEETSDDGYSTGHRQRGLRVNDYPTAAASGGSTRSKRIAFKEDVEEEEEEERRERANNEQLFAQRAKRNESFKQAVVGGQEGHHHEGDQQEYRVSRGRFQEPHQDRLGAETEQVVLTTHSQAIFLYLTERCQIPILEIYQPRVEFALKKLVLI